MNGFWNKKTWNKIGRVAIPLGLIVLSVLVFRQYRAYDAARTDTQPPVIQMTEQPPEVSVQGDRSDLLQGVTATDDRDGDVTASLVVESVQLQDKNGTVRVNYAAFDRAGNVTKASRTMKYSDYHSPRFSLEKPLVYTYGSSFDVLKTLSAADVVDGDIQHRIRATMLEESTITAVGTHRVMFSVSNSLGDTVKMELPVEVHNSSEYAATLTLTEYMVYLPVNTLFDPADYLDTYTRNRKDTNVSGGRMPQNFSMEIKGQVRTDVPGVYVLEYRVTYTDRSNIHAAYDPEYTGYSKLIVVVEE